MAPQKLGNSVGTAVNEDGLASCEYVRLGKTGMTVSRVCLGCMSYGSDKWQNWVLNPEESLKLIKYAWDKGVNFWDTANMYSNGESEIVVGEALKRFNIPRDQVVIATKVYNPTIEGNPGARNMGVAYDKPPMINKAGLSRKHIMDACDASLRRLGTSYIDLYQIHRFDRNTPIEETMEALHDLVKMGKVRYIGASSMWAHEFVMMNACAEKNGWTKFVSMQNFYNLIYREEEREMNAYCKKEGIALIPWSPLAFGVLAAKDSGSLRSQNRQWRVTKEDEATLTVLKSVAAKHGTSPSVIALAWLYSKSEITSPIVGINKERYLDDALDAQKVKLSAEEIKSLEKPYRNRPVIGHL
ncbi:hypothetical protein SmJEL517_g05299 [Synchytrium microbalum]|uniref:NADP-dependent oxidoreductase domain-containing protein n=1 Tax=Synchytrium microbalum TaxID=1806994 RepID=A0A507C1C7_9FUNG|nr:uncharacterized protein SmJEL517_g05299 [Synchytrium microbalum]TPX31375.1 hypothetical protein SmJEL517_g05299 [Synchytrium microbalum]